MLTCGYSSGTSQIAVLQDDKKALERHLKLNEAALVEAGDILRSALERALIVEDVQNQNIELKKQMEIYHVCAHINPLLTRQSTRFFRAKRNFAS